MEADMRVASWLAVASTMVLVPFAACKKQEPAPAPPPPVVEPAQPTPPAPAEPTAAPPAAPAATLSDAQIAAIVVTANQVDIDAGNLAAKTSKNADVKKFANLMVTDHTGVNKAAVDLVTKLGVKPEETDASRSLASGGKDNLTALGALSGEAFDKAYVDHEVAYHQAVIDVLDKQLIPSASNAELKKMLVDVRPAFVAHLDHAKHLQSMLAGDHGAAPPAH
jgi:putative membrane protein